MKQKFEHFEWREKKQQNFDKEKITLTKAGETFNVYDKIQENTEDTEIYKTLEKYGCIENIPMVPGRVYAQFEELNGLRDLKEQQILAENMFYNLPLETRQKFNNNMNQFVKDGEKYVKKLMETEKQMTQEPQQQITDGAKNE